MFKLKLPCTNFA